MSNSNAIKGSCLCGAVTFSVKDEFKTFNLCHCAQCQKISGSAHVANLFTQPDNIEWLSGQEFITRYDVPGREIRNEFCSKCGTNVPYVTHSGQNLIVPAGCLSKQPSSMVPEQVIFWAERLEWYEHIGAVDKFDGFRE